MVWYGHCYVTVGITIDDFVILSRRPRKPIPAGTLAFGSEQYEHISLSWHSCWHTLALMFPLLGIVMLFKLHTSVTTTKVQSTSVLGR